MPSRSWHNDRSLRGSIPTASHLWRGISGRDLRNGKVRQPAIIFDWQLRNVKLQLQDASDLHAYCSSRPADRQLAALVERAASNAGILCTRDNRKHHLQTTCATAEAAEAVRPADLKSSSPKPTAQQSTVIITGASSGLGLAATKAIISTGTVHSSSKRLVMSDSCAPKSEVPESEQSATVT